MGEKKYLEALELSELRRHTALDAVVGEVELGESQLDAERARVIKPTPHAHRRRARVERPEL